MAHKFSLTRLAEHRRGAVTVEFALTLPALLILFFASLEFARANMIRNTVENAAYEGARKAILIGGTPAQAETAARKALTYIDVRDATVTVAPATFTDADEQVTVTILAPLDTNGYVVARFLRGAKIERSCTLTREKSS